MSNIKNALTRKMGPLPAWAWLSFLAVGVWYYRRKMNASGANASGTVDTGTGTGSVGPGVGLQALQPDQSYYDSGSGYEFTTPQTGPPVTRWRTRWRTRRTKPKVHDPKRRQHKGHKPKHSVPRHHRNPTHTRNRPTGGAAVSPHVAQHPSAHPHQAPHRKAANSHTRQVRSGHR